MNCCIFGAGAWGTAMALHLNRCGHSVTLVPRRMEHALALASSRENTDYLPGYSLPHSIQIGFEPVPVLMEAELVFFACPSSGVRELCRQLRPGLASAWSLKLFVSLCKGLEMETFKTPSEIMVEFFPVHACAALSGPTYAGEVAAGQPTAMVLAIDDQCAEREYFQRALSNNALRAYLSGDVRGTELGGTLKNIYAIASGMCDGLGLGDNAKAALLTRSLGEMVRLGEVLGGRKETFFGLSGFGDLVATCSGDWSRNRSFGQRVGQGESPESILQSRKSVVEGYRAVDCMKQLCDSRSVEAPILGEIYSILYDKKEPSAALSTLMQRDLKRE